MPALAQRQIDQFWRDGVLTVENAVTPENLAALKRDLGSWVVGPAGSVCLMHTRLAQGSAPNRSADPRTLLICVYSAGDAVPLTPNPVPTKHEGLFVAGEDKGLIRSEPYEVRRPQYPKTSFFAQQSEDERLAG